jgi:hypothetical protein
MKISTVPALVKRDTVDRKTPDDRTTVANLPAGLEILFKSTTGSNKANVASQVVMARLVLRSHGPRINILPSFEGFVRCTLASTGTYFQ